MRILLCLLILLPSLFFCSCNNQISANSQFGHITRPGEYILVVGGPALRRFENLRRDGEQHDRFWGNFLAASNRRADELKAAGQLQNRKLTYLVYRPSLAARGREDGKPYLRWAQETAQKRGGNVVFIDSKEDLISYINQGQSRSSTPIVGLEYFGHSNRYCFMLDYSADLYSASTSYLHEVDLHRIHTRAFAQGAYIKSWGCYTGESMSAVFRSFTGQTMIGASGPTNYEALASGELPSAEHWLAP